MIGKEWTREFFDDYIIWLEHTLFKMLQRYNAEELEKSKSETDTKEDVKESEEILNDLDLIKKDKQCDDEEIINSFKNIIDSLEINTTENFIEYLLQSINNPRYPERAFLFNVNYIDNCDMNQFYFSLLEKEEDNIFIDQNDKIEGLKLLLSEFLYQCGYDHGLKIQESLLIKNIKNNKKNSSEIMSEKKTFENVKIEYKNGTSENVTIFYGKIRGNTTWYIKTQNKIYRKITKNNKGEYTCGEGKIRAVIKDKDIVEYISKDYN